MALSGQKTVTTAGTAVNFASQVINGPVMIKALSTNTGIVALGNDGANDVTIANGIILSKSEAVIFQFVGNLASLWLDSYVSGEGVSWIQLSV